MTKRITRITAVLIGAILFIAFILFQGDLLTYSQSRPDSISSDEKEKAPPPNANAATQLPVDAIVVNAKSLTDAITVSGSTVPNEEVIVTTEVPGKIEQILFKEGTLVTAGTSLIILDQSELKAERSRLVVQRNLNEKIANRLKALYDKEGVSLQDYEVAAAEVEKAEAEIALLDAQLEKRIITAPFGGRLGLRMVSEGAYISPGTAIVNLVSINPIKLEFSVPEKYSRILNQGAKVGFQLDGSEQEYLATIIAKEPNVDPDTRTLRLKASAPNPGGQILPGAFAKVDVNLNEYNNALLVPTEAIMPQLNTKEVYVVRSGVAQLQEVETGIRQERMIQVTAGLSPGDTVITTGLLQLKPGTAVNIVQLKKS
ncbi:MAG: efflux RND transporter periplasmic adaptor subunit [Chitinophagales bacterium]|nr:efflux RND transporter periplasmic adaptor subunit [Chitinophagales bacterium]